MRLKTNQLIATFRVSLKTIFSFVLGTKFLGWIKILAQNAWQCPSDSRKLGGREGEARWARDIKAAAGEKFGEKAVTFSIS